MSFQRLDAIAAGVLEVLVRASWQAAVLAGMVLLVQWLLRERLSARWRYNLWLLVLLRLLIPVTPQSSLSVFNLSNRFRTSSRAEVASAPVTPSLPLAVSHFSERGGASSSVDAAPVVRRAKPQATATSVARAKQPIPWRFILACAWIAGTLVLLVRIVYATLRLRRAVRRMTPIDAPHVTEMLARCRRELDVRRRVEILASDDLAAPALMGVVRPRLLLPRHVLAPEQFAPAELRLILLHELGHLRRNDVLINWVVSLLHALHWFNPVLWLAFARLRADRELATDELVLSLTGDDRERRAYGDTIVKLLQSFSVNTRHRAAARPTPLVGAVGILERAHLLRRRITMIAHFRSHHAKRWTVLAACCMLALAGFGLTDAVRGDDAKPAAAPTDSGAKAAGAAPAAAHPATRPDGTDSDRIVAQAADVILSKPTLPRPAEIIAAADDVAKKIRAQRLVYGSDGKPANEAQVNAEIERAQALLVSRVQSGLARQGTGAASASAATAAGVPVATAAALRKLHQPAPEISFDAVPFAEVVQFLRDTTDLNIFVNWRALEAAGVDRNVPVSLRLKNIPFEQALRYILLDAGGGTVALDFAVVDGIVNISTADEVASDVKVRVYNIVRLLHNLPTTMPADPGAVVGGPVENKADRVIAIIRETVAPDSWRDAGGAVGSIREINGRLVVAQTEANHALIAKLLEEISDGDADEAAAAATAATTAKK